ncbi:MAG: phasin family protein [Tsuneonella sp.]
MTNAKTAEFRDTVKNAAADVQNRAKAAYEKLQAYAGDVTEMNKGNVKALVESGKIFGAGLQDMARSEVEAAKDAFATATADLKALAAVKSPTELFKLQGEIARRNFDAAVARFSKNAEVSLKLANDAFAPISSRMSLAAEKVSQAA